MKKQRLDRRGYGQGAEAPEGMGLMLKLYPNNYALVKCMGCDFDFH